LALALAAFVLEGQAPLLNHPLAKKIGSWLDPPLWLSFD
jgi:hypothetical protein